MNKAVTNDNSHLQTNTATIATCPVSTTHPATERQPLDTTRPHTADHRMTERREDTNGNLPLPAATQDGHDSPPIGYNCYANV